MDGNKPTDLSPARTTVGKSFTAVYIKGDEKKNSFQYKEIDANGKPYGWGGGSGLGAIYLQKDSPIGCPDSIEVTVRAVA